MAHEHSTRGCCSYEIRRRHQVDTRGTRPSPTLPCHRPRSHPAGARPAPKVEDYEGGDLMPNGGAAQLLCEAGSERWWREYRDRGLTDGLRRIATCNVI